VIPEIDIWRVANLMLKRYGHRARQESARHADELWAAGDATGEVIWLRIGDVIGQLANTTPPGPLHSYPRVAKRESRFAHQAAMDKLGAALRRVAKFRGGQRVDASAASLSRLKDSHSFACACKLAGSHEARSARANDQKMRRM